MLHTHKANFSPLLVLQRPLNSRSVPCKILFCPAMLQSFAMRILGLHEMLIIAFHEDCHKHLTNHLCTLCRPQPWMSMTRQANSQPPLSPALQTPANQDHSFRHPSVARSSDDEAAASASLHLQHQSLYHSASHRAQPHSEGIFGRQRAAQQAQASVPSNQHMPADHPNSPRPVLHPAPSAQQGQNTAAPQPVPDALDRFNARRGRSSAWASTPLQPAEQPFDALDRFNARRGFAPQASAPCKGSAAVGGLVTDRLKSHIGTHDEGRASQDMLAHVSQPMQGRVDQLPGQSAISEPVQQQQQQQQARHCLDALDRFNRRKGSKLSSRSSTPAAVVQSGLHSVPCQEDQQTSDILKRCKRVQPQQTSAEEEHGRQVAADDSQQSQSTLIRSQHVSSSGHGRTVLATAEGFTATHTPDALDRINSVLLARRSSRTDVPAAKRCRSSASPDAQESSTHAQTGAHCNVNQAVNVAVHQFEPSSAAQACKTVTEPSGMYSSRPHTDTHGSRSTDMAYTARDRPSSSPLRSANAWDNASPLASAHAHQMSAGPRLTACDTAKVPVVKKRMRAFGNDDDDSHLANLSPTKKSKVAGIASAVCDSRNPGNQHTNVFMRLAK